MENKIDVLEDLRDLITNELNISRDNVPSIGKEMSLDASILFLFLTPEKSDPETKGIISLRNDSFVCKSLREQMSRVSIPEKDVLVWNLYGAYGIKKFTKKIEMDWLRVLNTLVKSMDNLKVIVGCGGVVWKSFYNLRSDRQIFLLPNPELSARNLADGDQMARFDHTWDNIKKIVVARQPVVLREVIAGTQNKLKDSIESLDTDKLKDIAGNVEKKFRSTIEEVEKSDLPDQLLKAKNEFKSFWRDTWSSKPPSDKGKK